VNQPVFDYRNQLHSGTVTLPCWLVSPEQPLEDLLNPIGMCWYYNNNPLKTYSTTLFSAGANINPFEDLLIPIRRC